MSSTIFTEFIYFKIEQLVKEYVSVSRNIFVDKEGQLIHPGEFGSYRERIISQLISPLLPHRLSIGTGFIITDTDKISTQCDVIIYDTQNTPLIENGEQRFFPIECVAGVIEVKSKLSKGELKDALRKLSRIKALRNEISSKSFTYRESTNLGFNPMINCKDQMATFLICEDISFEIKNEYDDFFKDTYTDIDAAHYHNMILCMNKCCALYFDGKMPIYYPYYTHTSIHKNCLIAPHEAGYEYEHFIVFLDYFYMVISSVTIAYIEFTNYIGTPRPKILIKNQ